MLYFLQMKKHSQKLLGKILENYLLSIGGLKSIRSALKQLCNLNKFFVRKTQAIFTHIFCSLRAFCQLELMRVSETIENWYEVQRNLYIEVARRFITNNFHPPKLDN